MNAFHPFELVARAWTTCEFPWYTGEADVEREQPLTDVDKLHAFAKRHHDPWVSFVLDVGDALDGRDPAVTSHRGDVPFSVLLESSAGTSPTTTDISSMRWTVRASMPRACST